MTDLPPPVGPPPSGAPLPPPIGYGVPSSPWPGVAYGYGQAPYQPTPSHAMAIWALVLSCLFFIPIAVLVGIGLAIAVLVRSRDGLNHGRGKAITALVIGGLVVLAWVGLIGLAVAASTHDAHRDSAGAVTRAGTVSVERLQVGDCFDQSTIPASGDSVAIATVDVMPCGQAHDWEVYDAFALEGAAYPGRHDVVAFAEGGCLRDYQPFTGAARTRRSPDVVFLYPRDRLRWAFEALIQGIQQAPAPATGRTPKPATATGAGTDRP